MAHRQSFCTEDLVILKSSLWRIGQIDRTASDVSTHDPTPALQYPVPITKGRGISKLSFKTFLRTGVPPRGTVLVNWVTLPWQDDKQPILLKETELDLVDRALLAGDVVKKDLTSPMSGTVIETETTVSLVQPSKWPTATSSPAQPGLEDNYQFGNYMTNHEDMVHGVSTQDLKHATEFNQDQFILYHNWIGKVVDTYDEVYVRLGNGSVVVVEDPDELDTSTPEDAPVVGDFVRAKKANLRRGRWIYGKYDPSIDPSGFVADVRPVSIEVDWLARGPNPAPDAPPYELGQDDIQSGQIQLLDRSRSARSNIHQAGVKVLELDICAGDTVRFQDLAVAVEKYHGQRLLPGCIAPTTQLQRIQRTDSLGFDINVFMVAATYTLVKVLWQDNTITKIPATDVIPFLDMSGSGDVWPGDLVAMKTQPEAGQDIVKPSKVGIVQSTDAKQRIAKVRWFPDANVSYALEVGSILGGSYTGALSATIEDVSLYEIDVVPGFERRLGDLVCLVPQGVQENAAPRPELAEFIALLAAFSSALLKDNPADNAAKEWFGEVIDLGLDGLLTLRLLGADVVRDVKVPWEGTVVLAGSDMGLDASSSDDDMDYGSDEDSSIGVDQDPREDNIGVTQDHILSFLDDDEGSSSDEDDESSVWMDEEDNVVEGQEEWETDEEVDNTMEGSGEDTPAEAEAVAETQPVSILTPWIEPPSTLTPWIDTRFSYTTMFPESSTQQPAPFAVLDTPVPADQYYSQSTSTSLSGARLRRIQKEHKILRTSLPAGVYVRTWESKLDLLRVMLLGPYDTPYQYAPFVIDMHLDDTFPNNPPRAFFHSWTDGSGPVNPNLYEDGKICLSLLGTWPGDDKNETWSDSSTILQIIVSILGLVLVKDPYYNEAGYEARMGTVEARIPAALYAERAYFKTRGFIQRALAKGVAGLDDELRQLYMPLSNGESPRLLYRALEDAIFVIRDSEISQRHVREMGLRYEFRRMSAGALIPLRRQVNELMKLLEPEDVAGVEYLRDLIQHGP